MELPKGLMNNVPTTTSIKCPVVETYRKGRQRTLNRPKPDQSVGITYNSNVTMAQLEKYWILSAVQQAKGSIQGAAKLLGMARETVYRKVREYNREAK